MLGNDLMEIWHLTYARSFRSNDTRSIVRHFPSPVAARGYKADALAGGVQIVVLTSGPRCAATHGKASRIASSKRHGGLITANPPAASRPGSIPSSCISSTSGLNEARSAAKAAAASSLIGYQTA